MDPRIGRRNFTPAAASSPPWHVLDAVDAAAARIDELHRAHRELHFEIDELTGRVTIEVRTLDGRVIRAVSPSEALDIIAGDGL